MITVSDDDGRVLDLLLNQDSTNAPRETAAGDEDPSSRSLNTPDMQKRIAHARAVLSLLNLMPVEEPSRDLVASTLRAIRFAEQADLPTWTPFLGAEPASGGPAQPSA